MIVLRASVAPLHIWPLSQLGGPEGLLLVTASPPTPAEIAGMGAGNLLEVVLADGATLRFRCRYTESYRQGRRTVLHLLLQGDVADPTVLTGQQLRLSAPGAPAA